MARAAQWTRRANWIATVHLAVFGDRRISLPPDWSYETLVGIFGDAEVDASATARPKASLTVVGVFADRRIDVAPTGGPQLTLNVYAFFSDVRVIEAQPQDTTSEESAPPGRTASSGT